MMITRNNYEEFFLLYADNELPASVRKAVEAFVQENPDLGEELLSLQDAVLVPDSHIVFENKAALLKQPAGDSFIDSSNCEDWFLLYADNELDEATKKEVELFAGRHPLHAETLALLLQTRLQPDMDIVFDHKEILYKKEETKKVMLLPWFRIAAAALVLLLAGFFIFNHRKSTTDSLASTGDVKTNIVKKITGEHKKDRPAVTSVAITPLDITEVTKKAITGSKKSTAQPLAQLTANSKEEIKKEGMKDTPLLGADDTGEREGAKIQTIAAVDVVNSTGNKPAHTDLATTVLNDVPDNLVAKNDHHADAPENTTAINYALQHLQGDNAAPGDASFYIVNTSAKKNKLRGIFRKVSRVFDKEASADNDNDKHGVLIGSFQIALK